MKPNEFTTMLVLLTKVSTVTEMVIKSMLMVMVIGNGDLKKKKRTIHTLCISRAYNGGKSLRGSSCVINRNVL